MRSIQKAAWLAVVLAMSAAAQEETAETASTETEAEPKRWSIGVGTELGGWWWLPAMSAGAASLLGGGGEVPRASLELAPTPRWSIGLGVSARYFQEAGTAPNSLTTQPTYGAAFDVLGRYFLGEGRTRLSLHLGAGAFTGERQIVTSLGEVYQQTRYRGLSVKGGFAVDLRLLDGLGLRAAMDVASVTLGSETTEIPGQPATVRNTLLGGVGLFPRLELRVAF